LTLKNAEIQPPENHNTAEKKDSTVKRMAAMISRLIIPFSFAVLVVIHTILESSQAFLSAVILTTNRRPHFTYLSATNNNANDEQEDANIKNGSLSLNTADVTALDVVVACMDGLSNNDTPWANAGLEICFEYSSDRNRAAQGGSLDDFITYASNPTFSAMVNAKEYSVEKVGAYIPGTMTRGAMQTVLIKVQSLKGEERSFLW
jgi:hypothetical protein